MSSSRAMVALAALLASIPAARGQESQPARGATAMAPAAAATAAAQTRATTVFVDANFGSRKNGAAKALSNKHAEMEAQGWRFAHLATYNENGDLVGFFVTYVR